MMYPCLDDLRLRMLRNLFLHRAMRLFDKLNSYEKYEHRWLKPISANLIFEIELNRNPFMQWFNDLDSKYDRPFCRPVFSFSSNKAAISNDFGYSEANSYEHIIDLQ